MASPKRNPVLDFTDQNGRVAYDALVKHVRETNVDYFVRDNRHPFLVGKELYDGLLYKDDVRHVKTLPISREEIIDDTSFFKMLREGKTQAITESGNITRAVFMLRKKPFFKELGDTVTVGRHSDNDLVVADYSISRFHAKIIIHFGEYFVLDADSANGTYVDGAEISPGKRQKLEINGLAAFGRIVFMFMAPADLHEMIRVGSL